jgi:hypothetical protein
VNRLAQSTTELAGAALLACACAPAPGASEPGAAVSAPDPAAAEMARLNAHVAQLERRLAAAQLDLAEASEHGERAIEAERELAELRAAAAAAATERPLPNASQRRLAAEVTRLRYELEQAEEKRIAREAEWLAYTRAVSSLELESLPGELEFRHEIDAPADEPAPMSPEAQARAQRDAEILRTLRTLLTVEEVVGIDLMEAGALDDAGWTGPVVFRVVDGDGRLAGSLWAERLRLEGSRTARTLTLVLEDGYETRRGGRTDFERPDPLGPGVRRIVLPRVDPLPWVESLPELFGGAGLDEPVDDGLWNLALVRGRLNELLRQDAAGGWYRLKSLAGVRRDVLRGVHVEQLDREGRVERHLFADRLTLQPQAKGVLLLFEDGAQVRGREKAAFLEGRYRVFLPRAVVVEWAAAGIPGFAEAPALGG